MVECVDSFLNRFRRSDDDAPADRGCDEPKRRQQAVEGIAQGARCMNGDFGFTVDGAVEFDSEVVDLTEVAHNVAQRRLFNVAICPLLQRRPGVRLELTTERSRTPSVEKQDRE